MKKYILIASSLFFSSISAQVIFNPANNQSLSSASVLVEFGTEAKGLLLPWVTNTAGVTGAADGTVVYDVSDKKVKYLKGGSAPNGWIDLSVNTAGVVDTSLQDLATDATGANTIIGDKTSTTPGILVLDSPSKAMVLPKVASPALNIVNPAPGMVVYDTTAKQVAFFNGTVWSYWKPDQVPTVLTSTGKIWMDRNLGATQVATSATDAASYGDLYQWGRLADGHEKRNSATTGTLSASDIPGNANFITVNANPNDWRSPQNTGLWQGVNGVNNPCPTGFRLPTEAELGAERSTFVTLDAAGAFASPLKLPSAGTRNNITGAISNLGTTGQYWTSEVNAGTDSKNFRFGPVNSGSQNNFRAYGFSVRCIKN